MFLGNLSHVLLDIVNHPYNPVYWPFLMPGETPSALCSALGGMENASIIIHTFLAVLFIALFFNIHENFGGKATRRVKSNKQFSMSAKDGQPKT